MVMTTRLYLLPIISVMFIPMGFLLTYVISVWNKTVSPFFPMISDTGNAEPGNYIFGMILHTGSLLYCISGIYAYLFRRALLIRTSKIVHWKRIAAIWTNRLMLVELIVSTFGGITIAHIELNQNPIAHFVGAMTTFGGAIAYMASGTLLTLMMPLIVWLSMVRVAILLLTTGSFVGFLTHIYIVVAYGIQNTDKADDLVWIGRLYFDPRENGPAVQRSMAALIMGAFCEWTMSICYGLFMLTFSVEMSRFRVNIPCVMLLDEEEKSKETDRTRRK